MSQVATTKRLPGSQGHPAGRRRKFMHILGRITLYVTVTALGFTFALPLIWMVSTALKTDPQVYRIPPVWIPYPIRPMNFVEVLTKHDFGLYFVNTMRYALPSLVGGVVSSALVAYSFGRLRWWGRNVFFALCLGTMMIPFQVRMIPLYIVFSKIGWINSYKPLIIPSFFGGASAIFLMRQFFMTIPRDLSDAARVDGCNEFRIFYSIILPLSKPVLAVVALNYFMGAWNNYLGPLIYLNRQELYPLALGLRMLNSTFREELMWPYQMAASTAVVAPVIVVFFFTQRTLIEGITLTGIKG
jgi:ABC-type glycerol-3-phosphate transport system permease component